jgi:SRSO17 transposase
VLDHVSFPLGFARYQPQTCLKPGDHFPTKPELALVLIQQLLALGLRCDGVLADTVYGENATLSNALHQLGLRSVVAIRSRHGVWREASQRIRTTPTPWRPFERVCADGSRHER